MRVFSPLRKNAIALLWTGQVLSNVGDEIYNIALIWLAAGLIGANTGYISALQAASIFVCGLLGGRWADSFDHRRTMIAVDVLRGLAVLLVPLTAMRHPPSLGLLIPIAIVVSSLSALFLPALKASLPQLAPEKRLLAATNGLMESTQRLARVVGPSLVGLLNHFVPLIHFFTIDAISFFCSALSIRGIGSDLPPTAQPAPQRLGLHAAFQTLRHRPHLRFALLTSSLAGALWWLDLTLGMALLMHERHPTDVGALGWLMAAYGIGNLLSSILLGSVDIRRPLEMICCGRMLAGIGFVGLVCVPRFWMMAGCVALAAVGGPMTDLAFLAMLMDSGDSRDIARIYRLGMTLDYGCMVPCFLLSPQLFTHLGIGPTVILCGTLLLTLGFLGLFAGRTASNGAQV